MEHTNTVCEKEGMFLLLIITVHKLTTRFEMVKTAVILTFSYTLFENYFNRLKH